MAASARTAGTIVPSGIARNSGVWASRNSRVRCAARARAKRARRALELDVRVATTRRRTRGARRVPIAAARADEIAVTDFVARALVAASTSSMAVPDVSSARDAARPNRRQDRNIGTANTPFNETIIGILAEKP